METRPVDANVGVLQPSLRAPAKDDEPLEPVDPTHTMASSLRDHPDVRREWTDEARKTRSRNKGNFVLVIENNSTMFLCLDCPKSKLLKAGGGTRLGPSLNNVEQSRLRGKTHLAVVGSLAKFDSIVAKDKADDEPEYFDFVRSLDLRHGQRSGDDRGEQQQQQFSERPKTLKLKCRFYHTPARTSSREPEFYNLSGDDPDLYDAETCLAPVEMEWV